MLNVLSLFSGIGAFEKALTNLKIPFNLLAYCELDEHASKSYSAIHGVPENMNLQDVTKVDFLDICETVDLITYGFPCQDISNAGKQKGFVDENGTRTRSGLFFEALRIIDDYRPKFAIAENVKALVSKKFSEEFKIVLESLEDVGYNNYYAVLNAKDYEIPQNRERVFIISIRKDIDKGFVFPQPVPLELRLKDLLEVDVDEKYYVGDKLTRDVVIKNPEDCDGKVLRLVRNDYGKEVRKRYENGELREPWSKMKQLEPRPDNLCNTISTLPKDNYILVREGTKRGYAEAYPGDSVNIAFPTSKTRRGRVGRGIANTLLTSVEQVVLEEVDGGQDIKIRYFTPVESFKLMGFDVEDCKKAEEAGVKEAQLYKQAGNSIVVNVIEAIFTKLGENYEEFKISDRSEVLAV